MGVFDLVGRMRWALREADYARTYIFDERFRGLCRPENSGRYLTYFCYAGLANRFRSHFAACLVAKETNRRVIPVWIPTMHLESDGTDIFERNWSVSGGGFPGRYARLGASSIMSGQFRSLNHADDQLLVVLGFDVQWLPFRDVRNVLAPEGNVEFTFRSELIREARELVASLARPYLAVHVRQTDFVANKNNYKPISYYETEISAAVQGRKDRPKFRTLLIASDDRVDLPPSIRDQFENVVTLHPGKGRREAGVAGEALVHLLCLGEADQFIGTPRSSFSEFADAMLSGLVVVPGLAQ